MDTLHCIKTRRSIRKFTEQPVEFEKIGRILEAGIYAPSAGNIQNYRFVLVTDKGLLRSLYEHCLKQEAVYQAQFAIVVCGEDDKAELIYGLRGKRLYTIQNCACAAENMLLAAHAQGLGGCWIGAFDEDNLRSMLGLEEQSRPQLILVFGYPDENPIVEKKDLAAFVNFNSYALKVKDVNFMLRDLSLVLEKNVKEGMESGKNNVSKFKQMFLNWNEKRQRKKGFRPVMEPKDKQK